MSDLIDRIIRYERGEMEDDAEVLDLFQDLVNSGAAWDLQGHYGRTARTLIDAGMISGVVHVWDDEIRDWVSR
jgi:hypothetical protein